jgi:L-ornithine N5-oxygenase
MSQALSGDEAPVYDLIGVGFGPSNLALAIAITEHGAAAGDTVTAHFLERQKDFGWHRGMLIEDATMQVSFLKDLATMRHPTSEFSFLNYLHARGRLVDFINHKNLFPLRTEVHDYFEWCAGELDHMVSYGSEVTSVTPVVHDGAVGYVDVRVPGGNYRTRNVVLGTGLMPKLPAEIAESARIWHNRDLLHRLEQLGDCRPNRFLARSPRREAKPAGTLDRRAEVQLSAGDTGDSFGRGVGAQSQGRHRQG